MTSFTAELFISIHNIHMYTIGKFSSLYGMIVIENARERDFNDVHFILNLQLSFEFVWYSSIVEVAKPHEF